MLSLSEVLKRAFWSPAPYLCWVALTVFFAVSGPFDTYLRFAIPTRAMYFAVLIGAYIAWGVAARGVIQSRFPRMGFWPASLIVAIVSAVILPWPTLRFTAFMAGGYGPNMPTFMHLSWMMFVIALSVAAVRWGVTYGFPMEVPASAPASGAFAVPDLATAVTPLPMTYPVVEPSGLATIAKAEQAILTAPKQPRLFDRLPAGDADSLIRLSARNHYVDVVTDKGTSSVLMRLSDAIAELAGVDGLRVHRSHWVAARAVKGHERKGDKRLLILADGARIPVSRTLQRDVVARGFL